MNSLENKVPNWKNIVIEASISSKSASEAAAKLGVKYETYKKYAIMYECFNPNKSGKGISKVSGIKIPLIDILEGKHPQYQSNKLRIRLLEEKIFEYKCYTCNNIEWLSKPIPLELEHIDGNCTNHLLDNLTIICPNCHAFTETYRGKNVNKQR